MQRENAFYKRIVQIEFNAWHYVEGNLWASLVEHLFENLGVRGRGETCRARPRACSEQLIDNAWVDEAGAQSEEALEGGSEERDKLRARTAKAEAEREAAAARPQQTVRDAVLEVDGQALTERDESGARLEELGDGARRDARRR